MREDTAPQPIPESTKGRTLTQLPLIYQQSSQHVHLLMNFLHCCLKTGHEVRKADPTELIMEHVTYISQDDTVSDINLPGDDVEMEGYSCAWNSSTDACAEMTVDTSSADELEFL